MALNNGIMERMKAATHRLVSMEIDRNQDVRDTEAYTRSRLPEIFEAHQLEWRRAYGANKNLTIEQMVSMVLGRPVAAQQIAMGKAESNQKRIHKMLQEPVDAHRNARGLAAARAALRRTLP
jgi:hypothetical protein